MNNLIRLTRSVARQFLLLLSPSIRVFLYFVCINMLSEAVRDLLAERKEEAAYIGWITKFESDKSILLITTNRVFVMKNGGKVLFVCLFVLFVGLHKKPHT